MPTLDEVIKEDQPQPIINPEDTENYVPYDPGEQPSKINGLVNKILTSETGPGPIGDYLDHPMNFTRSKGLAQMLRGLTGIVGSLSLAIIDVGMGFLTFTKERKGAVLNDDGAISGSQTS